MAGGFATLEHQQVSIFQGLFIDECSTARKGVDDKVKPTRPIP